MLLDAIFMTFFCPPIEYYRVLFIGPLFSSISTCLLDFLFHTPRGKRLFFLALGVLLYRSLRSLTSG